jgi:hypothetical protein
MNISKDLIDSLNVKSDYSNFSEEVQIDRVTTAGTMTLYTVTNKNNVTFQQVPGQPGLTNRGFMGFVNGDRSRPIMLSGSVEVVETPSTDNTGTTLINQGGGGSGSTDGKVDMTPSVAWDIELTVTTTGFDDSVETKEYFIIVG